MHAGGRAAVRRRARRTGPLVLVLPLVFLVLGVLYVLRQRPRLLPARPPAIGDPEETVAGWSGELAGRGGARLRAWLAPLHAEAARQELDSRVLRERLDLPTGEPWRLTLAYEAPQAERAAAARPAGRLGDLGPARGEVLPSEPWPSLGLGPLAVRDGRGVALSGVEAPPAALSLPLDPLRTLLLPPPGALRPGQSADWLLWGRAPGPGARVEGLLPDLESSGGEGRAFAEATGLAGPLELHPRPVRRSDLLLPLAHLERTAAAGKSEGAQASQADGRPALDGQQD